MAVCWDTNLYFKFPLRVSAVLPRSKNFAAQRSHSDSALAAVGLLGARRAQTEQSLAGLHLSHTNLQDRGSGGRITAHGVEAAGISGSRPVYGKKSVVT